MKDLASRLEALKKLAGSNRALARLLGVTDPSIIGWLAGQRPLDSKVRGIAARTGLSEAWLVSGQGDDEEQLAKFSTFMRGTNSPRERLMRAIERSGMTNAALAKAINYDSGVVERALTSGRASERMIEAICRVIPGLDKHDLMTGSEAAPMIREDGNSGAYGAKVSMPGLGAVWNAPLLSFCQAGKYNLETFDEHWDGETAMTTVKDRRAFALRVEGDSMSPMIDAGDLVVVSPAHEPVRGKPVIVKTVSGEVFCKTWGGEQKGVLIFNSFNPAHGPLMLTRNEVAFIYPVAQQIKNHLL